MPLVKPRYDFEFERASRVRHHIDKQQLFEAVMCQANANFFDGAGLEKVRYCAAINRFVENPAKLGVNNQAVPYYFVGYPTEL
jgi:hypothetical protein